ncbi:MAG: pseudouridine synthase [Candidatus Doudnabacteria bacterium]
MAIERLQKFLSNAGIASRRGSEIFIERGEVRINGNVAKLGDKVDPDKDQVTYKGKLIRPEKNFYYIALNKPKAYITSRFDPEKRRSVFSFLPKELQSKVWTVGRLDFFTEGLLLFTNDGDLTEQLAHPKFEHEKEYEVTLSQDISDADLQKIREGVVIGEDYTTAPAEARIRNGKIYMTIHEGKKRQIRRMFDKVGYKVKNLKRMRINKLELGDLPLGKTKNVTKEDII